MLNVFLRSIILYIFLLVAMRFMGKRQLSEFQPFEFAITLVVADLACIPMSDNTIPIIYGIIPIFTLVILNNVLTFLSQKSHRFRHILNGKPQLLISEGKVQCDILKKCGMTANDLLESIREQGYFNINTIEYAILETNGKVSILSKFSDSPVINQDMNIDGESTLPYNVIVEGRFMQSTLELIAPPVEKQKVLDVLEKNSLTQKNIFLFSIDGEDIYIHTFDGKIINTTLV